MIRSEFWRRVALLVGVPSVVNGAVIANAYMLHAWRPDKSWFECVVVGLLPAMVELGIIGGVAAFLSEVIWPWLREGRELDRIRTGKIEQQGGSVSLPSPQGGELSEPARPVIMRQDLDMWREWPNMQSAKKSKPKPTLVPGDGRKVRS